MTAARLSTPSLLSPALAACIGLSACHPTAPKAVTCATTPGSYTTPTAGLDHTLAALPPDKGPATAHERDLRIELKLKGASRVEAGSRITAEAWLINRSKQDSHLVLRPGDGSERKLREPTVTFAREARTRDGRWLPLGEQRQYGCGLYDRDVQKDIVKLGPGQRLKLGWIPAILLPGDQLGRFRVRLVYRYQRGHGRGMKAQQVPAALSAVPAFTLRSNPVVIEHVASPLRLKLEQLAPVHQKRKLHAYDVFRVTLINCATRPRNINAPGGTTAALGFELYSPNGGVWPKGDRPRMGLAKGPSTVMTLPPGKGLIMLGPSSAATRVPGTWTYPVAETFRIRALLSQPGPGSTMLYSNWVTVKVLP